MLPLSRMQPHPVSCDLLDLKETRRTMNQLNSYHLEHEDHPGRLNWRVVVPIWKEEGHTQECTNCRRLPSTLCQVWC